MDVALRLVLQGIEYVVACFVGWHLECRQPLPIDVLVEIVTRLDGSIHLSGVDAKTSDRRLRLGHCGGLAGATSEQEQDHRHCKQSTVHAKTPLLSLGMG